MADSLFPFIDATVADAAASTDTSVPTEYAWDFERNDFVLENGAFVVVTGLDALKIWVMKALITQRYRYAAYNWDYGQEFETLIGQRLGPEALKSEAQRFLSEALTINPHITDVKDVVVALDGARVTMDFTVVTDQGEAQISV